MIQSHKIIPVILCGGAGTRLWPLSRERSPKQFHAMVGDKPLLHETLERAINCSGAEATEIITVTTDCLKKETIHQLADFDTESITHIISEPVGRNTAAAIAYAALYAQKHFDPEDILWILPSDHYIKDHKALSKSLEHAAEIARNGAIVTFGMTATKAETGYGYIKSGANIPQSDYAKEIEKFIEKPDLTTAQEYLKDKSYLWNSGMFIGSIQTLLGQYKQHCPEILTPLEKGFRENNYITPQTYAALPALPFDRAIMEKTKQSVVIPCDIGWSDAGTWENIWEIKKKDKNNNVIEGRVITQDTENCLIYASSVLIAAAGLRNIVIVENNDYILIADKNNSTSMAPLMEVVKKIAPQETIDPPIENRPWGRFKILSKAPGYKVKEILVKPGKKLSLQMHRRRSEFWTLISGEARVTINDTTHTLKAQESIFIPVKSKHQLENTGTKDLIIVEVQCGDYLGEDDIIRFDTP